MGLVEGRTAAHAAAFRQVKTLLSAPTVQSAESAHWLHLSSVANRPAKWRQWAWDQGFLATRKITRVAFDFDLGQPKQTSLAELDVKNPAATGITSASKYRGIV